MSSQILVCCRSDENVTRQEIAQAIVEGVFFDDDPEFDPPLDSAAAGAPRWGSLVIRYAEAKRPVVIFYSGAIEGIEEDIEEEFESRPLEPELKRRLVEAKQVFTLDFNPESLTEEAWMMCDIIEHILADRCDGLIYAPGDGIFDAKLQPIAKVQSDPPG